jgi:hypothetical protein
VAMVDLLYPRRRCPGTGDTCLLCPDLTRLVVCLPADVTHDPELLTSRLAAAVGPHIAAPTGWLDSGQFMIWHPTDPTEDALLLLAHPDPELANLTWCAGGPVGLLDLSTTVTHTRLAVADDVPDWATTVAGTPPAQAWWHYHDAHRADPHSYPLDNAVAEFVAQPRITAMAETTGTAFTPDMYGPGLEALHTGPDAYGDYQSGLLIYGDGLIDLDGQLLLPADTPQLVEQTLPERQLYHQRAGRYLASLDPTVVLAAVRCFR